MPQVKSRVNNLIINIPADAAGVVRRFGSEGDNELIFDKDSLTGNMKAAGKASAPVKIGSEPKSRARPRSAEALA